MQQKEFSPNNKPLIHATATEKTLLQMFPLAITSRAVVTKVLYGRREPLRYLLERGCRSNATPRTLLLLGMGGMFFASLQYWNLGWGILAA